MAQTNAEYQNVEIAKDEIHQWPVSADQRLAANEKGVRLLNDSHYLQTNYKLNSTLNATLSPAGNVRGSANRKDVKTTNTMRSMSFMPLRYEEGKSGSRAGQNSMIKIQSSQRGEEFSVAEMSAQVMLDLNDINTEASQQLNASYGAGT